MTQLIPNARNLLDNGFSVMLIGRHGTGKTTSVNQLASDAKLKVKYYSCSTLDPYTDLVGVPEPVDDGVGGRRLNMVRPRDIDEAEFVFFDEFNRADRQTLNAIFEIIQFHSINGEPLPHLKACWAAMNPPDDEQGYEVRKVDPALADRFDVFLEIKPVVDVSYLVEQGVKKHTATVLQQWWTAHKYGNPDKPENYLSPRRIEKMARVWDATHNRQLIAAALPQQGSFLIKELITELTTVRTTQKATVDDYLANFGVDFSRAGSLQTLKQKAPSLESALRDDAVSPSNKATIAQWVADTLGASTVGQVAQVRYVTLISALPAPVMEGWWARKTNLHKSQFRTHYKSRVMNHSITPSQAKALSGLHALVGTGAYAWPNLPGVSPSRGTSGASIGTP